MTNSMHKLKVILITTTLCLTPPLASYAQYIEEINPPDTSSPQMKSIPLNNPVTNRAPDIDFGPYMADLQRRIKAHWFPPKGYEQKRVTVKFKIHKDGSLSDLQLDHPSGIEIPDNAALDAVEKAAPFRPLPAGEPKESVAVQFTFDYNVFTGGRPQTNKPFAIP